MKEWLRQFISRFLGLDSLPQQLAQSSALADSVEVLRQELAALKAELTSQVRELDEVQAIGRPGHCMTCQLKVADLSTLPVSHECPRCGSPLHRIHS